MICVKTWDMIVLFLILILLMSTVFASPAMPTAKMDHLRAELRAPWVIVEEVEV